METIMRKLTAMALSMMFILGSVIPVGAEETQIRQTKISVSIDPVYTVTIPANTIIERGEQSVKLGSVSLDNARLEPDKTVNVSVSASGKGTQTGQKSISSMYAKLKKGSQYKAYFSGIASTYDNKQTFMVAQDAHITFTYR